MGEVWIKEETLTAIGDAVRAKTGASGLLAPDAMITALDGVKSSGKYLFSKKETSDGGIVGYAVTDNLAKYPDGGEQDGYYWELASKIKFYTYNSVDTNSYLYYAAEGMTWEEWIVSPYNTNNYYINSNGYVYGTNVEIYIMESNIKVLPTDVINPTLKYVSYSYDSN